MQKILTFVTHFIQFEMANFDKLYIDSRPIWIGGQGPESIKQGSQIAYGTADEALYLFSCSHG